MDDLEAHDRIRRLSTWLDASPAEIVGLSILLLGGIVLTWWFTTNPGLPAAVVLPEPVQDATPAADVTVHVAGAVERPGVYALAPGARVAQALEAAGGALTDADLDAVNLARPVADGEQLRVPVRSTPAGDHAATTPPGAWSDGVLDLNRATAAELEELPGIGPVLAERILAWRDEHGPFPDAGALREVPGIGEATFQRLADVVTVR